MFNDWKQAWRQAVDNFQSEVRGDSGAPPRVRSMERELVSAAGALSKLEDEIHRTSSAAAAEREAEQICRRRESLAQGVGDDETVRIAREFAVRHAERGAVLGRKLDVLRQERTLLARDIAEMKKLIAEIAPDTASVGGGTERAVGPDTQSDTHARDFSRMEREARERAAAERLEELKRRMNG
ncbi:hypothetical protein BH23GEM9_BH23GEM9_06400 [soil metagenome]